MESEKIEILKDKNEINKEFEKNKYYEDCLKELKLKILDFEQDNKILKENLEEKINLNADLKKKEKV